MTVKNIDEYFATLQMPLSVVDFASEHSFVRKTLPLALENKDLLLKEFSRAVAPTFFLLAIR